MGHHEMKLQAEYFAYMKNGTKRIELRLFDEKRSKLELGDIIDFENRADGEVLKTRVVGLLRYVSFEALIEDLDVSMLADASVRKDDLLDGLRRFYTNEDRARYGVLGIRFEIV